MLSDRQIIELVQKHRMIDPFVGENRRRIGGNKIISFGLGSYGYDIRMANEVMPLKSEQEDYLDPKVKVDTTSSSIDLKTDKLLIDGNSGLLTRSVEYFRMPENVSAICLGKSTYARCGLIVNVTPLEPGWEGNLTIEIVNTNPFPVRLYPNEGIAQLLFFENEPCEISYKTRGGKYQGQTGITGAKV